MSISMNFINLSDFEFKSLCSFKEEPGLKTHAKVPSQVMDARHGNETLEVKQEWLSWYVDGHNDASVKWYPGTPGEDAYDYHNGFGIKVHAPLQWLSIGKSPRWSAGHWLDVTKWGVHLSGFFWDEKDGDDKARKYTFPDLKGYTVEVEPDCGHSSISLKCTIRNAT